MPLLPDHAPGERAIIKLIETVTEGIGAYLRPWQVRREGRARNDVRRDELLMLEQLQRDVDDVRAGTKRIDERRRVVAVPAERREPYLQLPAPRPEHQPAGEELPKLVDAARRRDEVRDAQRTINLHKVVLKAEEIAEETADAEVSEDSVAPDWFEKWRTGAESVSDDDV